MMNPQITQYINEASPEQKQIMEQLRQIIHENVPGVTEEFKWSRPVFRSTKDFAYFKTSKAHLTLGFTNFANLVDKDNLLEGTGKDMRHIKIRKSADINTDLLAAWFKAAAH